jgi:PPK2 family polyphosphate:nucleotide phosphotransferase
MKKHYKEYLQSLKIKPGKKIYLKKDFETDCSKKPFSKEEGATLLKEGVEHLSSLQDVLYASDRNSILIVLQAMDASGKDGTVKHVLSGLNPNSVNVNNFKSPTHAELDHDYLWRHYKALPARGEIGIFNRSHYENVLITRVHPEFIVTNERLPGITSVKDIKHSFWEKRYKQINHFEKTLAENGTLIIKFFLYVSKNEQKKRFIERLTNPEKNWKFTASDVAESKYWNEYMIAYEEMLNKTSNNYAPWYVIPADDKWFSHTCISDIIYMEAKKLKLSYPEVPEEQKAELKKAKEELLQELNKGK